MVRHFLPILAAVLAAGSHAVGATEDTLQSQLARCATRIASIDRLHCYDRIVESLDLDSPLRNTERQGQWIVHTDTSPMDDSRTVQLRVDADDTIADRFGANRVRPVLHILCRENTTSLIVDWDIYIGIGQTRLRYRIDSETAQTATWSISTNHEAFGLWNGATSIGLIRQMFGRQNLLVQTTPYGENSVMVNFNITGLEEAIAPLREACNW